jgi:hypothetical protein
MSRLRTVGFEARAVSTTVNQGAHFFEGFLGGSTAGTIDTTLKRSGANSLKLTPSAATQTSHLTLRLLTAEQVLGRWNYIRGYFNFTHFPVAGDDAYVMVLGTLGGIGVALRIDSGGQLQLMSAAGGTLGSPSAALSTGVWYRIELGAQHVAGANDAAEAKLDGTTFASATGLTSSDTAIGEAQFGWIGSPSDVAGGRTVNVDDIAWNDDQGAGQNSWPGAGKIVCLLPTSDNQRGSWTGGSGGTTNLFEAVNNTPPAGTASESNTTQIESADSSPDNATDEYRVNLATYTSAGIVASDTLRLVQMVVDHGEDAATGTKTGSFLILSNPAQGVADTFTFGEDVGALGTWPTNWRPKWGTAQLSPSVTLGTAPVLRLRKVTASTAVGSVDFMGLMVEYQPAAATAGSHRLALLGVGK